MRQRHERAPLTIGIRPRPVRRICPDSGNSFEAPAKENREIRVSAYGISRVTSVRGTNSKLATNSRHPIIPIQDLPAFCGLG